MAERNLNSPLLGTGGVVVVGWREVVVELKRQLWLAGPLIAVNLLQYSLQFISVMYVGHLGELALSGAAIATSFAGVTGFDLLLGMGSALESFCGQAYGAKQYHMLGVHKQNAMLVLTLVSIPLAIVWANTSSILKLAGQDPAISEAAGEYARWMIPSIFAYGLLQCYVRFLQAQNIVIPMMLCTGITALLHLFVCWILVFKSGLGYKGAALANAISYWANVLLLALYVRTSPNCKKTWTGFSMEAWHDIFKFLELAVPSAIMVCLEFWSFELMVLLSGLLPNPKLETSVLCICLNTSSMIYMIFVGLGAAVSVRVSNELGAGQPKVARLAAFVMVSLAIALDLVLATIMVAVRGVLGYTYSNVKDVVEEVATIVPLVAISSMSDATQCVLSGTIRGCGWQKIGAFINLGAFYIVGIPSAVLFAFVLQIGGRGLWMGIICGLTTQALLLLTVTLRIDWEKEAQKAKHKVHNLVTVE